eukprot:TRINITY_DN2471_c0_g1_i2.p1 TRINITY_DN2471_c0_g1~~TRINITY_DN2471_c0_g1_i2.p1  ORF type:complete len:246 (+),score=33.48 TRINITY_DN2471_c0_g1_i2:379-1116(+)
MWKSSGKPLTPVPGLANVIAVAAGSAEEFLAALDCDHNVYVWGQGVIAGSPTPERVEFPAGVCVQSLFCGGDHIGVIDSNNRVYLWGQNNNQVLGVGSTESVVYEPTLLPSSERGLACVSLACGKDLTFAIANDGHLWGWGFGKHNLLTDVRSGKSGEQQIVRSNTLRRTPVKFESLTALQTVSVGANHAAVVTSDGFLYVWGFNERGKAGDHSVNQDVSPTKIKAASQVEQTACGGSFTLFACR